MSARDLRWLGDVTEAALMVSPMPDTRRIDGELWTDPGESTTTRTPLADVDTSRFDLTIEQLVDRLRTDRAALIEAAQVAVSFMRCVEWDTDSAGTDAANIEILLDAAIATAERA